MFNYIFFDFDGTLMDTSKGVFNSFDKVVEHYGLDVDKSVYSTMIGPPLLESFKNTLGLPDEEIQNAMKVYRDYYSVKGMFEADVYDGVVELIKKLRSDGKKIYVATSKPQVYAEKILEKKGMLELFDFVGGADLEEKLRVNKVEIIDYVLYNQNITDKKNECLMIGDRFYDVNGAHKAGLKCAGILWGFGSESEFKDAEADFILKGTEDVYNLISCK